MTRSGHWPDRNSAVQRKGSRRTPRPHGCGVVRNDCCDVSAPTGAPFKKSAAPLPPPKPAIACTSWPTPESPKEPLGGSAAIFVTAARFDPRACGREKNKLKVIGTPVFLDRAFVGTFRHISGRVLFLPHETNVAG